MFISTAFAQTAGGGNSDIFGLFMPLILIFAVFYFLLIRPQQKKQKEHQAMIASARRGDTVVTAGGIVGKVTKVKDDGHVQLEIADNVRIEVVTATLADIRSKTEPGSRAKPGAGAEKPAEKMDILAKLGLRK